MNQKVIGYRCTFCRKEYYLPLEKLPLICAGCGKILTHKIERKAAKQ